MSSSNFYSVGNGGGIISSGLRQVSAYSSNDLRSELFLPLFFFTGTISVDSVFNSFLLSNYAFVFS